MALVSGAILFQRKVFDTLRFSKAERKRIGNEAAAKALCEKFRDNVIYITQT